MAKLKDVAEKAEVSLATASLALTGSTLVNEKTREKVEQWAKKLSYYPNIYAQKLARRKSYNICIMLNNHYFFKSPNNIYYLRVIGGIIKEAENTEYTISFSFYGDEENNSIKDRINLKSTDGIIIFDVIDEKSLSVLRKDFDLPILLIDNHKNFEDMYGVDNDDLGGAFKATSYLISQGHKKIGYIGVPDIHPIGRECWKGFKKALDEMGLVESFSYKECSFGIRSGRKAISILLTRKSPMLPTALFGINDYIAIGAMEELKARGYKVPEDISIVGMDDMDLSSEIDPPLTTIRIKMEELGKTGLKKMINLINKNYKDDLKTIINNELVIRSSCKDIK
jgi:DNA-binding LacI/PurR family transcriptional regulator